jgi:hypothetical protein
MYTPTQQSTQTIVKCVFIYMLIITTIRDELRECISSWLGSWAGRARAFVNTDIGHNSESQIKGCANRSIAHGCGKGLGMLGDKRSTLRALHHGKTHKVPDMCCMDSCGSYATRTHTHTHVCWMTP